MSSTVEKPPMKQTFLEKLNDMFGVPCVEYTIYPAWRIWPIRMLAKLLGVLIDIDGVPFGSNRIWLRKSEKRSREWEAAGGKLPRHPLDWRLLRPICPSADSPRIYEIPARPQDEQQA